MSDGKYFSTTKRGEIPELKGELNSLDRPKKKEAVKKVIAAMTVGKDVSMLFPDVVNCMQTDDLELKKLVYLYLINYAKTQPDLAIMAVNTFVKDSQDPNPLIRALAVRTMGCIRVDKITEYLCDPLQRCLKDDDPYVRKTAAVCVTKLFDINAELVEDRGFLDMLRDMLMDNNPMVVANAIASLQEIQELSGKEVLQINSHTQQKLLTVLNECNEWGQVFILDSLAVYDAANPRDAESIVERVLPRLQHVNSAVVLSAIKVIMKQMDVIGNEDMIKQWCKKMAPPLVTLLSAEPEVQYVALRNINLIVQKRPQILAHEVKVFFCKYNDPIYVKMEKLEIMIKLASEKNIDQVLLEFKEYAQEVDVDFVRKAVRAIGRCAVALDKAAERCINVLLELIQTKVNYVVQEAIVVIKDIFRRYPNKYESIIGTLCENLESLDEPEAKASMIWIIGEYAERIDNADELLETFLETFPEETSMVQLQLLTSTVKLFLKKPTESAQKMISLVLSCATSETDNPDLRDRAYVYWRLLSTDAEAAKEVVLAEKPIITDDSNNLDPLLLDQLLGQLATLAAVYHKPADTFVSRQRMAVQKVSELAEQRAYEAHEAAATTTDAAAAAPAAAETSAPVPQVDLLGEDLLDLGSPAPAAPAPAAPTAAGLDDLLGGLSITPAAPAPAAPAAAISDDPFAMLSTPAAAPAAAPAAPSLPVLLPAERGKGLTVSGKMVRVGGQMQYSLAFTNNSASPVDGLMIQFNNNAFGMVPANQVVQVHTMAPGTSAAASVPVAYNPAKQAAAPANAKLQVALKTAQLGVFYWDDTIPLAAALEEGGTLEPQAYLTAWRGLGAESSQRLAVAIGDVEAAKAKLAAANIYVLAHRPVPNSPMQALYITCKAANVAQLLMELRFTPGMPGVDASFKSERPDLAPLAFECLNSVLA